MKTTILCGTNLFRIFTGSRNFREVDARCHWYTNSMKRDDSFLPNLFLYLGRIYWSQEWKIRKNIKCQVKDKDIRGVVAALCHDTILPVGIYALEYQNVLQAFSYCPLKKHQRVPDPLISVWKNLMTSWK